MLLVDDDRSLLFGLFRVMRRRFDIQFATSGYVALDVLRDSGPFDVIITDWQMPGLDGVEFLQQANMYAPDAIKIMLTGSQPYPKGGIPELEGVLDRYLVKPAGCREIQNAIDQLIAVKEFS